MSQLNENEGDYFCNYTTDYYYQEIKYLVYSCYRIYSTDFCVRIVFTERHSLAFPEHDVITKEVEASVMLTVCFGLLWQDL